jgi:hypothetical protein
VISSGRDYRVPPPPGSAGTHDELRQLARLISQNTAAEQARIEY